MEEPTDLTKRHELVHISQIKDLGFFKFYGSYFVDFLKKGYKNNKYEKDARNRSKGSKK